MNTLFNTTRWIYEKSPDNKARYVLGERGDRPLVCIGVNPSTAEPGNLDPTLNLVRRWSNRLGYDGWIMLNLYPQRSTDPNGMHKEMDQKLHLDNIHFIREALKPYHELMAWAAWGTLIEKRSYLIGSLKIIAHLFEVKRIPWITIGPVSKKGHPHHPLYLPRTSEVQVFDIKEYLKVRKTR